MGIIDTVKDLAGLAQKAGSIDLYRQAVELMQQVTEQQQQIITLREEVKALKEQSRIKEALKFERDSYWKEDGTGPFCPRCFDVNGIIVRMLRRDTIAGPRDCCPECRTEVARSGGQRPRRHGPVVQAVHPKGPSR